MWALCLLLNMLNDINGQYQLTACFMMQFHSVFNLHQYFMWADSIHCKWTILWYIISIYVHTSRFYIDCCITNDISCILSLCGWMIGHIFIGSGQWPGVWLFHFQCLILTTIKTSGSWCMVVRHNSTWPGQQDNPQIGPCISFYFSFH
jgi:hypothetical protein